MIIQAKNFNNRIIRHFFRSLLYLPKIFFDSRKIGDMTARLNDTRRIQLVIGKVINEVAINMLICLVSFILLFVYSWKLALLSIIGLPIYFFIVYRHNKHVTQSQRYVMSSYALAESYFINTIQGIASIKNFNRQNFFSKQNQSIYGNFQNAIFSLGKVNIRLDWQAGLIGVLILLSILIYGCLLVLDNNLKLGELMAIIGISGSLLPSVSTLALIIIPINEAKVAFDRMFEFISISSENETSIFDITNFESLQVNAISFRFQGNKKLLNDVSFSVNKNEIVSIAGESGCGKSTLCQIIEKFYLIESGNIVINNSTTLDNISTKKWRTLLGVVSQEINIFNGTVLYNITLNDSAKDIENAIYICQKYGIEKYIKELPQGYLTMVGEDGINLSGGQKQLITFARAICKLPKLLILDEATSAMDSNMEKFILNLLLQLKSEMGILFISHRLHILKDISDKIVLLENGTVSISGTHNNLMVSNNLYSTYWNELLKS